MSADRDLQAALFLQLEENIQAHYQAKLLKQPSPCKLDGSAAEALLRALPGASENLSLGLSQLKLPNSQPAAGEPFTPDSYTILELC